MLMLIFFRAFCTWSVTLRIQLFLGCTVSFDSKETELESSNQETSLSVGKNIETVLTLFRTSFFRLLTDGEGAKKTPHLPKICHTYPTMMKLGGNYTLPKEETKNYDPHDTPLEFCIFSLQISKFCYIKKHRYRFYFDIWFLILSNFFESIKIVLGIWLQFWWCQ